MTRLHILKCLSAGILIETTRLFLCLLNSKSWQHLLSLAEAWSLLPDPSFTQPQPATYQADAGNLSLSRESPKLLISLKDQSSFTLASADKPFSKDHG